MRFGIVFLAVTLTLTLTHCASYDFSRRHVQQGNLLPKNKIDRLRIGMSKHEVADLLGNSTLSPVFNNNRWDYAYTVRKGSGQPLVRNLILHFSQDRLTAFEHHP
jgi:outer membrane protein assembly factor BamE